MNAAENDAGRNVNRHKSKLVAPAGMEGKKSANPTFLKKAVLIDFEQTHDGTTMLYE